MLDPNINIDLLIEKIKFYNKQSSGKISIENAISAIKDLYPDKAESYINLANDFVSDKEAYMYKLNTLVNNELDQIYKVIRLVNFDKGSEELMYFLYGLFVY